MLAVVLSSFLVLVNTKCPSFFEEYNSACYYLGNNRVNNVNDAFRTCYSLGGYLLNVDAEAENSYIVNKIKQQPTSMIVLFHFHLFLSYLFLFTL